MTSNNNEKQGSCLITRRSFLFQSGAAVGSTVMLTNLPGMEGKAVAAQLAGYPKKKIGRLSALKAGKPVRFRYPDKGRNSNSQLIKLGTRAGGGIGPDENVVAFNSFCTHQGGPLVGQFQGDKGIAGPCPLHWTTFDLNRHGMVISGHATQGLPQITLELEGDDIVATGVMGLIFSYGDNKENPTV